MKWNNHKKRYSQGACSVAMIIHQPSSIFSKGWRHNYMAEGFWVTHEEKLSGGETGKNGLLLKWVIQVILLIYHDLNVVLLQERIYFKNFIRSSWSELKTSQKSTECSILLIRSNCNFAKCFWLICIFSKRKLTKHLLETLFQFPSRVESQGLT